MALRDLGTERKRLQIQAAEKDVRTDEPTDGGVGAWREKSVNTEPLFGEGPLY